MKSYTSYRMYFHSKYTGQRNKFGGLPTHLPPVWPRDEDGTDLTFLCQLYCDGVKLSIKDTLCIQLYQWVVNGEEGTDPIIVAVPLGARENSQGEGLSHPRLPEGGITFEKVVEKIVEGHAENTLRDENGTFLWTSKLKGWFQKDAITPDNFLGMISDGDGPIPIKGSSPFNWGCGYKLAFYLNDMGDLAWDFI